MDTTTAVTTTTTSSAQPTHPVLTPLACEFLKSLHRQFEQRRQDLLQKRVLRQNDFDAGIKPDFNPATGAIRHADWIVAPAPTALQDRRVEITGPVERKMMINALNSGANVFMADFEDATSPTWENVLSGQLNCIDAVRRTLSFESAEGKVYRLAEKTATLVVRPRGWHLNEKHFRVEDEVFLGASISASLFDFGLYFFHNAQMLLEKGQGPYFYLPKIESAEEAQLWADVFEFSERALDIPKGSIRATVLIETITAAFEMDEILYALKDYASGLNAGRWDYIFSYIKKFRNDASAILSDRARVTMQTPFMRAYAELLVKTCHRRNAHAMGGMAAFIPNRKDPVVTENALTKVREDKTREATIGFDGTWVAHPDLIPIARECFDHVLEGRPHQKEKKRDDVHVEARDLLSAPSEISVTSEGIQTNINVALQYIARWLSGLGAVAIHNLMEDAATAEISRAQLWQWLRHQKMSREEYVAVRETEVALLREIPNITAAAEILDELVLSKVFPNFLTTLAYERI